MQVLNAMIKSDVSYLATWKEFENYQKEIYEENASLIIQLSS